MVVLEVILFVSLFSFLFLIIGLWRKNYVFSLLSGVFFIILGTLISFGVTYVSGVTETYSYMCTDCIGNSLPEFLGNTTAIATITSAYEYSTVDNNFITIPLTALLLLLGLFLIVTSWLKLFYKEALGIDIYLGDGDSGGSNEED